MKRFFYHICCVFVLFAFGCEEDPKVYNDETSRLNFVLPAPADTLSAYTFVFEPQDKKQDTFWMEVETMGFLSEAARPVVLEQIQTGTNDARPGVHYIAFDSEELKGYYIVAAGKNKALLPIILLRDTTLKNMDVNLKIQLAENDAFKPGYTQYKSRTLVISDQLVRPEYWNDNIVEYFGEYGPAKHQFMIDVTGERIDNEYFKNLVGDESKIDWDYLGYLQGWYAQKLDELNDEMAARGEGPLTEKDGTEVSF